MDSQPQIDHHTGEVSPSSTYLLRAALARKLSALQAEIEGVPKTKRNDEQNYAYTSAEDIVATIRPLLVKHGLAILASTETVAREVTEKLKPNGQTQYVRSASVRVAYTVIDTETGYAEDRSFEGDGVDYGDKALAKAYTAATKAAMRTLFLIDLPDDPEKDSIEAGRPVSRSTSNRYSNRSQGQGQRPPAPPPAPPDGPPPSHPAPTVDGQIERAKRLKDRGEALGIPRPSLRQGMTADAMQTAVDAYEKAIRSAEAAIPAK